MQPFSLAPYHHKKRKKGSINDESDNSEDDQEASPQQLVDGNPTLVNKSLWPTQDF